MSTSLSEQLKRLAVPQTSVLQTDKKRASLLFDPKEAATIRRETIYQIGLDGLEELITRNCVFEKFRHTLFTISSKKFERSMQTPQANKLLDKTIRKFLLNLSPYFLLNSAHKALEWLINRYYIHEYNRKDLLMLILPYHESNIFVRVIQLMKFRDQNDSWFFLKSLQKQGVYLTKQSLLTHAAAEVSFIKFVGRLISQLVREFENPQLLTVAFNFYCTVFTGVIEFSTLKEAQISQMLPSLCKGLSSDISDYCAASYVILGRLLVKTSLTNAILDTFVKKISNVKVADLSVNAGLTLLILYQSQSHYNVLAEEACDGLLQKEWFLKVLKDLNNQNYFITPLLKSLICSILKGAIKKDKEEYRRFVEKLLAMIQFDKDCVNTFISALLRNVKSKTDIPIHIQKWLNGIIETLDHQYPNEFDSEIYKVVSSTKDDGIHQSLQKIIGQSIHKYNILTKLFHPNATIRKEAIRYLTQNFDSLRNHEKETIKTFLIDLLNDDDVNVVKETLHFVKNTSTLQDDSLRLVLIKLTHKCHQDLKMWNLIGLDVFSFLCSHSTSNDWRVLIAIFSYLLPTNPTQLKIAKQLSKISFIKNHSLLNKIDWTLEDCEMFCDSVFNSFKNDKMQILEDFLLYLKNNEEHSTFDKYLVAKILSLIVPNETPIEVSLNIVKIFVKFQGEIEFKSKKSNSSLKKLSLLRKGKCEIEDFLISLKEIVLKTKVPNINLGQVDFSQDNPITDFFMVLVSIFFKNFPNNRNYILFFVNHFCQTLDKKVEFLLNVINCETLTEENISECVDFVTDLCNQEILNEEIIPLALMALLHKSEDIKRKVYNLLKKLANKVHSELFTTLFSHREEIIADSDQLALILCNYFSSKRSDKLKNALLALNSTDSPIYLKAKASELLTHLNDFNIFEDMSKHCLKYFNQNQNKYTSAIIAKNLMRLQTSIAKEIHSTSHVWQFIKECLQHENLSVVHNDKKNSVAILCVEQLTKEVFTELKEDIKIKLLDVLVETATITKNPEMLPTLRHFFKVIDLDLKLMLPHFSAMRDVQSPKLDPNKLKRRISVVPTSDILDTIEWRKGVSALEFIHNKKKIRNLEILLPILSSILKKCLDFDEQAIVEYPKQLILSSILYFGKRVDSKKLTETTFNMELIVQCIRASQNPQTHYCALLVLAFSAELFPSQVLHNIMAIFTFVGSSLLRHEDVYSFQIIYKVIDSTIPILVKDGSSETIARVLRVFVDALLDVPEYRRIPIYKHLLSRIGPSDFLYIFLLLTFESEVHISSKVKDDESKRLEVVSEICREFEPKVVIENATNLIKYLKELPDEFSEDVTLGFDIHFKSPKQFRHFRYTAIVFVSKLLSSKEFVFKVAMLEKHDFLNLEQLYKDAIINILMYIHKISKVADKNGSTPQAKYWKIVLHLSYDVLDSVNAILTPQMFVLVIKGLMLHNFVTVRRRSIELLNAKLQSQHNFFSDCSIEEVYTLLPPLLSLVKNIENVQGESEDELIIQTAFLSLKLLVKLLKEEYTKELTEIFNFLVDLIKTGKAQNNVLASVLLCLAELCTILRAYTIPSIPKFMPAILKILKRQISKECSSLVLLSCITAVQKIVETLPLFLSPYLEKLLCELAVLYSEWDDNDKAQPVTNKLTLLGEEIGTFVPPRVLIPILEQSYNSLVAKGAFRALPFVMMVVKQNFSCFKGNEINANLPQLTNFFLNALQLRSDQQIAFEQVTEVETHVVKALIKFVLKLSESAFKSFYYKLYDWAIRHEQKTERLITFYLLSSEIAEALKSLFVGFASHFINNAALLLDSCNVTKSASLCFNEEKKNILFLESILKTLHRVFLYDNGKFLNKDRFNVLMQPLVDQLENSLGGVESLEKRNEDLVTPAIVQFSVAAADDSLWKLLNYQILLKMKHSSSSVKLISIHCLKEMVKTLGVDYLPLLPEAIPVLAELLEDDEEVVEKACRKSIQEMEKILGEPIEQYFKP